MQGGTLTLTDFEGANAFLFVAKYGGREETSVITLPVVGDKYNVRNGNGWTEAILGETGFTFSGTAVTCQNVKVYKV
jgi:hypothetical protein